MNARPQQIQNGLAIQAHLAKTKLEAAAPDLLAACERALLAIEWTQTAERMEPEDMADMLREAIEKATI